MRGFIQSVGSWLLNADQILLAGGLLAVASLWCFAQVVDALDEEITHKVDRSILAALRSPDDPTRPIGPVWGRQVGEDITALGGFAVLTLVTLAVVGFLWICRCYHALWLVLFATVGGAVIVQVLKVFFARPRPDIVPHLTDVHTASFPSGHSMLSATVYLTLGALLAELAPRVRLKLYVLGWAFLISVLVGLSRIYLGVHYPTDVLGGWTAGLTWALLCSLVGRWLQQRGVVEKEMSPERSR